MGIRSHTTATKAALVVGIFLTTPGNLSFTSPAVGQPIALAKKQSDARNTYNNALSHFKSVLGERRRQIDSNQRLPNLPGQALYLARINIMSAYKDLTDALPSKIGRPNKFAIPPEYFDADTMSTGSYSTSWRHHPSTRKIQLLHSRTLSTWALLLREPRALMRPMPKRQGVSAWDYFLRRRMAIKT